MIGRVLSGTASSILRYASSLGSSNEALFLAASGACRAAVTDARTGSICASSSAQSSEAHRDGSLILPMGHKQGCATKLGASMNDVMSRPSLGRFVAPTKDRELAHTSHEKERLASDSQDGMALDGRKVSDEWLSELVLDSQKLAQDLGRPPSLAVILVGSRPDSVLYVTKKQEACQRVGIDFKIHHLPETISQTEVEGTVQKLCQDPLVDGLLIQLPLPVHLSDESVMEKIDPKKDVDGFHPCNMGRLLMRGRGQRLVPCTPLGCIHLLLRSEVDIKGRACVVVGDSNIVGTPIAALMRDLGAATVTICHRICYQELFQDSLQVQQARSKASACMPRLPGPSKSVAHTYATYNLQKLSPSGAYDQDPNECQSHLEQLPNITRTADILVVAVGHTHLIKADWVKPGAIVLDVGINVTKDQETSSAASASSPQPSSSEQPSLIMPDGYRVVGDVDFKDVSQIATAVSPVPGGVGPMTIAALIHNTLKAARYNAGLEVY